MTTSQPHCNSSYYLAGFCRLSPLHCASPTIGVLLYSSAPIEGMGQCAIRCGPRHALQPGLSRGFIGLSHQTLWFCEVWRTKTLRGIEDAKPGTKWISDYRAFPNSDVERGHEDLASLRCIMSYGNNDIID
jgi:hypothetical protein